MDTEQVPQASYLQYLEALRYTGPQAACADESTASTHSSTSLDHREWIGKLSVV